MNKKFKIKALSSILALIITMQTSAVFATEIQPPNSSLGIEVSKASTLLTNNTDALRTKAKKQNKVVDMDKYDQALKNAKTPPQKAQVYKDLEK